MTPYDRDIERFSKVLPAPVMVVRADSVAELAVDRESGRVTFQLPIHSELSPRDYVRVEEADQNPRLAKVMAIHITCSRMSVEAYMPFRKGEEEV